MKKNIIHYEFEKKKMVLEINFLIIKKCQQKLQKKF